MRHAEKLFLEMTHQRHGPFHKASHFFQQAFIFNQLKALRKAKLFGLVADQVFAPFRINHHLGAFQLLHVVRQALDCDGVAVGHKPMAIGHI